MTLPCTAVMELEAFYFSQASIVMLPWVFYLCSWQLSAISKHKHNFLFLKSLCKECCVKAAVT